MNRVTDVKVSIPGFSCLPKDFNQMTVLFETKSEADEALASGKLTEKCRVVEANFDWQNRENWGGHIWIKWEKNT